MYLLEVTNKSQRFTIDQEKNQPLNFNYILRVHDILGKEVATLVNEVKNIGIYTLDFSGSSLASGVYFYKLSVGDFTSVQKMTLLK